MMFHGMKLCSSEPELTSKISIFFIFHVSIFCFYLEHLARSAAKLGYLKAAQHYRVRGHVYPRLKLCFIRFFYD